MLVTKLLLPNMIEYMSRYELNQLTPQGKKEIDKRFKKLQEFNRLPIYKRIYKKDRTIKIVQEIDDIFLKQGMIQAVKTLEK